MFNDGTDPTVGIDKDYQNGLTATLNFPKIQVGLDLLEPLLLLRFFFTLAENVKLDVLIRIRLKMVTGVIFELQTRKSKIQGI